MVAVEKTSLKTVGGELRKKKERKILCVGLFYQAWGQGAKKNAVKSCNTIEVAKASWLVGKYEGASNIASRGRRWPGDGKGGKRNVKAKGRERAQPREKEKTVPNLYSAKEARSCKKRVKREGWLQHRAGCKRNLLAAAKSKESKRKCGST